ncbi:hypothetical protein [Micromonospora rubida]
MRGRAVRPVLEAGQRMRPYELTELVASGLDRHRGLTVAADG